MRRATGQQPLVELDGADMAHTMWAMVRDRLITPAAEIPILRFNLPLRNRELTKDNVTIGAAAAVAEHGAGVKCSTITPTVAQATEYDLGAQ